MSPINQGQQNITSPAHTAGEKRISAIEKPQSKDQFGFFVLQTSIGRDVSSPFYTKSTQSKTKPSLGSNWCGLEIKELNHT